MKNNNISDIRDVGQYFKKDQIFCGTLERKVRTKRCIKERFKENKELCSKILKWLKKSCTNKEIMIVQRYDIFYKDEKGYTCFSDEGAETFSGDNSDGKGIIKNLVSIWDYYDEKDVKECIVNGKYRAIAVESLKELKKYNSDYNRN